MNAAEPQYDDVSRPALAGETEAHRWKIVSSPEISAAPGEGTVLAGRYRLLSPLGEGGMGSVWRARSMTLEVDVAVKVVKRTSTSPRACERLLREARAAACLAHPSIVKVFDFGTTDEGQPFLVMQLLRGNTLRTWLHERGRLPATTAVQLILPIAAALADVHGLGIMHRDIKPENIIIEEGRGGQLVPVLVDFGIAKHSADEHDNFTQSGVLMGSPAYMSPEQARGKADPLSDIWSLCVVLYEMMTGKRPFDGVNHGAVLFAVFADEPEPTHAMGAGDEELWSILHRGLAKKQAERWRSMQQLGSALAAWAAAHGVTEDSAGTSLSHQWLGKRSARAHEPEQTTTPVPRRSRSTEHDEPARDGPAHDEPAHDEPAHDAPAHDEPAHDEPAQHSNSGQHVHMISSQPAELESGAPVAARVPLLSLGGAIIVVVGILTFLALAPSAPPEAEVGGPLAIGVAALQLTTELPLAGSTAGSTVSAGAAVSAGSTVSAVPTVSAGPAVTPAPEAVVSAAPRATVQTPPRQAKTATVRVPAAPPRRPPPKKAPMPLPRRPDF